MNDGNAFMQTLGILGDPSLIAGIREGEAELARGEGTPLNDVAASLGFDTSS